MNKNFMFYRCFLEKEMAAEGEPGLLAATEVVQAVCDAGFQRNGLKMKCYPSSPHCYYKYAKTPKEGMYMMWAVKKSDMTTLDILIDTRLYPSFVMIEKHKDWQEEAEEVRNTLEQVINDDADKYNWHINLREHNTSTTQHLEEFISALSYIKDQEDVPESHKSNVQIGQLILKVNGNNYYHEGVERQRSGEEGLKDEKKEELKYERIEEKLKPLFYNNEADVRRFLKEIDGMPPNTITDVVNLWVKDRRISNYGNSRKGVLWGILKRAGLYNRSRQNWNGRVD
jgi:hypothetical protein